MTPLSGRPRRGPVAPVRTDTSALRPLGLTDVTLGPGFWGDRQQRNRTATMPHVAASLETAGNFANLRAVVAGGGPHQGMLFADSDVYKWLEALGWSGADPAAVAATTELLAAAQDDDGYLDTYFQLGMGAGRWTDLPFGHELYCLGHLIQAAVADVRGTGATALLDVARRFADLAWSTFGPDGVPGVPGHPEVETALVELYRETRDERYLTLAGLFLDRRGHGLLGPGRFGSAYYQDDVPVRSARIMRGHAVRALYLATGMLDVYVETGDRSLLDAVVAQWDTAVATQTYLTGAHGSRHTDESFGEPYELPPDRAYAETCAGIASVMLCWRLLLITGEGRYADDLERALYNVVAASTSDDGKHFYYVNPLQVRGAGPDGDPHESPEGGSGGPAVRTGIGRQPWFDCACCPPNLLRLLASLHCYVATVSGDGAQVHLYCAGSFDTTLPDGRAVGFDVATDYPSSGRVTVTITRTDGSPWSLSLRIPGWSRHTSVSAPDATRADARGYAVLTRPWRVGDVVTLDLDLSPQVVRPHPRIDAVRGCVAFTRGPLVYCLEQVDQSADLLDVAVSSDVLPRVGDRDGRAALELDGVARTPTDDQPYSSSPHPVAERPVTLVAIPYHAWANREPGAMRVWVPTRPS